MKIPNRIIMGNDSVGVSIQRFVPKTKKPTVGAVILMQPENDFRDTAANRGLAAVQVRGFAPGLHQIGLEPSNGGTNPDKGQRIDRPASGYEIDGNLRSGKSVSKRPRPLQYANTNVEFPARKPFGESHPLFGELAVVRNRNDMQNPSFHKTVIRLAERRRRRCPVRRRTHLTRMP